MRIKNYKKMTTHSSETCDTASIILSQRKKNHEKLTKIVQEFFVTFFNLTIKNDQTEFSKTSIFLHESRHKLCESQSKILAMTSDIYESVDCSS